MFKAKRVVLDTDVLISASISQKGAAYLLINLYTDNEVIKYTSSEQIHEYELVIQRCNCKRITQYPEDFNKVEPLKQNIEKSASFTIDSKDIHIINLAVSAKAQFLITYNMKHYKIEELKRNQNIICMTPGIFLQYLRIINN